MDLREPEGKGVKKSFMGASVGKKNGAFVLTACFIHEISILFSNP